MNRTEYRNTERYRNHLLKTLEVARTRLNDRDLRALADSLRPEIARLNEELLRSASIDPFFAILAHQDVSGWNSISISLTGLGSMIAINCPSIRFNSPANAVPWTSRIAGYNSSPRVQTQFPTPRLSYAV
jgi:hypothetical protein